MYSYQDGWTPLLYASSAGATDVRCLLDAGADSKVRSNVSKRVVMYTYVLSFNYTVSHVNTIIRSYYIVLYFITLFCVVLRYIVCVALCCVVL